MRGRLIHILLSVLCLFGLMSQAQSKNNCKTLFIPQDTESSNIDIESLNFISLLSHLWETRILTLDDIRIFLSHLKSDDLVNPIGARNLYLSAEASIFASRIDTLVENSDLDIRAIIQWCEKTLTHASAEAKDRSSSSDSTRNTHSKLIFYPIEPGSFDMGPREYQNQPDPDQYVSVTLTNSIEMSSMPITQFQWVSVMGANPSRFSNGNESITINKNGRAISLNPNHPVEGFTWWSGIVFLNELSKKYNYPPAYDITGIEFYDIVEGDNPLRKIKSYDKIFEVAARGALHAAPARDGLVPLPKYKSTNNSLYDTQGFRYPTDAEFEFVLRQRGVEKGFIPSGFVNDDPTFYNKVWSMSNSGGITHPVGLKDPLRIDDFEFFDLFGNVNKFTSDVYFRTNPRRRYPGGVNPVVTDSEKQLFGFEVITRGGDYLSMIFRFWQSRTVAKLRSPSVGLVAVRTIHVPSMEGEVQQ